MLGRECDRSEALHGSNDELPYASAMEQDTTAVAVDTVAETVAHDQAADATAFVEEELLIEEISIDGMCGVY